MSPTSCHCSTPRRSGKQGDPCPYVECSSSASENYERHIIRAPSLAAGTRCDAASRTGARRLTASLLWREPRVHVAESAGEGAIGGGRAPARRARGRQPPAARPGGPASARQSARRIAYPRAAAGTSLRAWLAAIAREDAAVRPPDPEIDLLVALALPGGRFGFCPRPVDRRWPRGPATPNHPTAGVLVNTVSLVCHYGSRPIGQTRLLARQVSVPHLGRAPARDRRAAPDPGRRSSGWDREGRPPHAREPLL